ncbi:hypothetical protein HK405_009386 [Cladochytrium tenue]|nr:hypothetical protein HK405_009386 [Cladochytrium tenue]
MWGTSSTSPATASAPSLTTICSKEPGSDWAPPSPSTFKSPAITQFIQQAEFRSSIGTQTISQMLEDAAAARFAANAQRGRRAMESVIEKVVTEADQPSSPLADSLPAWDHTQASTPQPRSLWSSLMSSALKAEPPSPAKLLPTAVGVVPPAAE